VKTSRFRETNVGANFRQRWRECDYCKHVFCTIEQIL
jgi:transcriptional regulator NrdR family protein